MKKPTKKQLFFNDLRNLIHSNVTYNLDNIKEIEKEVDNYIQTQSYLKRVGKLFNDDLFMYIIAEKMLDIIIENLNRLVKCKIIYPFNLEKYKEFIFNKINEIGLYKMCICSPDVITAKFIRNNNKKIDESYYQFNDKTKKEKRALELSYIIDNLEKSKGIDKNIDIFLNKALNNINKELDELNI